MKNIGMVSEKLYWNTSRSFSNSHQLSYFQIKALADLNQERERELSSAFDKPLVNLCGKNQTYLCQAVCISTQSKPQTSVFQERNRPKNNYLLWNKMVQSSLKWPLGSSRRDKRLAWLSQGQLQTRLRFWSKLEIKRIHNALVCGAFCDINKSLTKLVSNHTLSVIQELFSWYCELLLVLKWWKCSFSQFIYNSQVISRVPNQYPNLSLSSSNHPSSFKTYWLWLKNDSIVQGAKS